MSKTEIPQASLDAESPLKGEKSENGKTETKAAKEVKKAATQKNAPAKTPTTKPAIVLTGVMAVANKIAEEAQRIAKEAAVLSGPLSRSRTAKQNEIAEQEKMIAKTRRKIERLKSEIADLDVEVERAEAGAIETLNKMVSAPTDVAEAA